MARGTPVAAWERLRAKWRWEPVHEDEPELGAFSDRACAHCVEWFGQPVDPKWPVVLVRGTGNSKCIPGWGRYHIVISRRCETQSKQFVAIAHEMFHRISWRNGGSRRYESGQAWLEELLACLTCHWILEAEGGACAVTRQAWYMGLPESVATRKLRTSHSLIFRRCLTFGLIRPKHFYDSVNRLGYALDALVGRELLCRLAHSHGLNAWIESLPMDVQAPVSYILGIRREKPALAGATMRHYFANALAAIGDREGAISEVQEAIRLEPDQPHFYQTLGCAYYGLNHMSEAIAAWKVAAQLDATDADAARNIASALVKSGEHVAALDWFREAARRQPARAELHFYVGKALAQVGDHVKARAVWEEMLTLNDEQHVKWARKALQESPLPDEAAQS